MFERSDIMKMTVKVKDLLTLLEEDKAKAEKKYSQRRKKWKQEVEQWKKLGLEGAATPPQHPNDYEIKRISSAIEMLGLHQRDTLEMGLDEYYKLRGNIGWSAPKYLSSGTEEYVTNEEMRDQIAAEIESELENPA